LLQEGENDVNISTLNGAASESAISSKEPIKPCIQFGSLSIFPKHDKLVGESISATMKVDASVASINIGSSREISQIDTNILEDNYSLNYLGNQLGSNTVDMKVDGQIMYVATPCEVTNDRAYCQLKEAIKFVSKPRTALLQGGEDDEPMAPQIIQFGSFLFNAKKSKLKKEFLANVSSSKTKLIFQGNNLCKEENNQNNKSSKYIFNGTMQVDIT
jgi:hypothetical protein